MAIFGSDVPTIVDLGKRYGGKTGDIIEILAQTNEILEDIPWVEANDGTGNIVNVRTGLPTVYWRMINEGVPSSKATSASVTDTTAELAGLHRVDEKLVNIAQDPARFRLQQASGFMEAMSQEYATKLFYGSMTSGREFVGLSPRYSTLTGAASGGNIVDAGGVGADNTSIWLVGWGPARAYGIYPKGTNAGIDHKDMGVELEEDGITPGRKLRMYRDWFQWDCGLSIEDWRYVVRIANIDVSDLTSDTNKLKALIGYMIEAAERLPSGVQPRWYMNKTLRSKLRLAVLEKVAGNLTFDTVAGKKMLMFDEAPVRRVDAILNTEARVV